MSSKFGIPGWDEPDDDDFQDIGDPTDRYEPQAPCPYCFESSGYHHRIVYGGYYEPDYAEPDPCNRCEHCDGTGSVDASEVGPDDLELDFYEDGYLAALDAQFERALP